MKKILFIGCLCLLVCLCINAQTNTFPTSGNVGIGTVNPQVNADITTTNSNMLLPHNSGATNTSILRVGYYDHSWGGVQLDFGVYNGVYNGNGYYPSWIQSRNPINYSISRDLLLNPNGGNVGIGAIAPDAKLTVKGNIHTNEVKVDLLGAVAPDYVFYKNYDLKSLQAVEDYIATNGHLPNIPSAKDMETDGILLKEMNLKLLEKIEELTLYAIQQEKRMDALEAENITHKSQEERIAELEEKLTFLLSKN